MNEQTNVEKHMNTRLKPYPFAGLGHFDMFQIQEACLAGGVAMGAMCSMTINNWGAILTGLVAGFCVTLAQKHSLPFLSQKLKILDARGISSLHGGSDPL